MRPRVIVTRPAREAARWVQALAARGIDAVALPLIETVPWPAGGAGAPIDTAGHAALMFVSAAAVDGFFERKRAVAPAGHARTAMESIAIRRCWVTGPGTAQALVRAGVPSERIDMPDAAAGRFDSEALWALVQPQVRPGMRVLLLRGGDAEGRATGRDWLARTLEGAGARVETAVVYQRQAPRLDEHALALARAASRGAPALWLFSSAEAIAHLRAALPGVNWSAARALVTHPRIAEAARTAGFGAVQEVPPLLDALVASIESFR